MADLAEPGAGAASYVAALRDFAYMHPDIVCVYDGYDGVASPGALGRHRSIVFRLTGYLPRSPARLLRGPDSIRDAEPAPDPIVSNRSEPVPDLSCAGTSASYCAAIKDTVRFGLERNAGVIVATPPYVSPAHEAQQRSLAQMLTLEFGREPRFRYVNLGRAIDPGDRALSDDGTHPTPEGARTLATRLADTVLELIRARIQ